jgi:hypothetical protein
MHDTDLAPVVRALLAAINGIPAAARPLGRTLAFTR